MKLLKLLNQNLKKLLNQLQLKLMKKFKENNKLKLVKQKAKSRQRLRPWEIVLIVLGFPIWFSLAVAVLCVLLAVSICLWVVVSCLFAVSAVSGTLVEAMAAMVVVMAVQGQFLPALFFLGCGMICAGLAILFFLLGRWAAKGVAKLHKLTFRGIKRCFIRKEAKA